MIAPLALVTGATTGIGLEIARLLAKDGHRLVLVARSAPALDRVADELHALGSPKATPVALDLSEPGAAGRLVAQIGAGGVDVLVNNAGFGTFGAFAETDADETHRMIAVNVAVLTDLTRALLPGMIARGKGRVLNVASTAAFQPGPFMAAYYASKAYVLSFTEALAEELRGTGVTATCLCPGPTATEFQARAKLGESPLFKGRKLPTARAVAEYGLAAMQRGQVVAIPGFQNRVGTFLPRLVPRSLAVRIIRRIQEKR